MAKSRFQIAQENAKKKVKEFELQYENYFNNKDADKSFIDSSKDFENESVSQYKPADRQLTKYHIPNVNYDSNKHTDVGNYSGLDRTEDILMGAAKNFVGDFSNLGSNAWEKFVKLQEFNDKLFPLKLNNEEDNKIYQETKAKLKDENRQSVDDLYNASNKLKISGNEHIENAKQGLNGFGEAGVELADAAIHFTGDALIKKLMGVSGLVPMALRSFGSSAAEARNDGASDIKQDLYGLGVAGLEVGTEKLFGIAAPLKKLFGKGVADDVIENGIRELSKKAAKSEIGQQIVNASLKLGSNVIGEASEEMIAEFLQPLIKRVVYDPDANLATMNEILYSGLMGGTLGGVLGGVGSAMDYNANRKIGKSFDNDAETKEAVIQTGIESNINTKSHKFAAELQAKIENGETVTDAELGELYRANAIAIEQENNQAEINERIKPMKEQVKSKMISLGTVEELAETESNKLAKVLSGEVSATREDFNVLNNNNIAREVYQEITGEKLPLHNGKTIKKARDYHVKQAMNAVNQDNSVKDDIQNNTQDNAQNEVMNKQIGGNDNVVNNVIENQQNTQDILMKAARRLTDDIQIIFNSLGEKGKTAYTANNGKVNPKHYTEAFKRFYDAGSVGLPFEKVNTVYADGINPSILFSAYNSGVNDNLNEQVKVIKDGLKINNDKPQKATFKDKRSAEGKEVSETTIQALKAISDNLNINIELSDMVAAGNEESGANGKYANGTVYLASDANRPIIQISKHEITHHIQNYAPKEFKRYKDYVIKAYFNNNQDKLNEDIDKRVIDASSFGIKMTRSEAMDEIVADATEKFLTDSERIDEIVSQDRNLAKKILEAIKSTIKKIAKAIGEIGVYDGYSNFMGMEELKRAEKLWIEALNTATKNKTADNVSVNSSTNANYSLNSDFSKQLDNWFKNNTAEERLKDGADFLIGTTSDALKSIGIEDYKIYCGKSKIQRILNEHEEMTIDIIKSVPKIIENPIIVMQSKTKENSITLLGEVVADNKPILVAMKLKPSNKVGSIGDFAIITSAYGKNNVQNLINTSEILYIEPNKNRTDSWLSALRLQLPSTTTNYGSINRISYTENDVKEQFSLKEYSEKQKENWMNSKSILVYENQKQLEKFINDALNDKNIDKKIYFGIIPVELSNKIYAETGVNVEDYNVALHMYEVRKILLNSHGDEKKENLRGQRAITKEDILNIPKIIQSPDKILLDSKLYEGKPVIKFEKEINGKTTVVTYTSKKHHDLAVQTMYANKNNRSLATATDALKNSPLSLTSETVVGTTSIDNNNILQNKESVKEQFSLKEPIEDNSSNDARFSLKSDDEILSGYARENTDLKKRVELLRGQFKRTMLTIPDRASVRKLSADFIKANSSETDVDVIEKSLNDLFKIYRSPSGLDLDKAYSVAEEASKEVVRNMRTLNDNLYIEYKSLRDYLRKTKLYLPEEYRKNVGNYNEFRKRNMGRFILSNEAQSVDKVYQELIDKYPEFFSESESNPADQLLHIADVLESLRPYYETLTADAAKEVTSDLAGDLLVLAYNIQTTRVPDMNPERATFADTKDIEKGNEVNKAVSLVEKKFKKAMTERNAIIEDIKQRNDRIIIRLVNERSQISKMLVDTENELKYSRDEGGRLQAKLENQAGRIERMRESREKSNLLVQIEKDAKWLSDRLATPTDAKHIPVEFRGAIADVLLMLDFNTKYGDDMFRSSGNKTKKAIRLDGLYKAYEKIAENETIERDNDLIDRIKILDDLLRDKENNIRRVGDLSSEEMVILKEILKKIRYIVSFSNKIFNSNIKASIEELGEKAISEFYSKGAKKDMTGAAAVTDRLLNFDNVNPYDKFHEFGGGIELLFREIAKGYDKYIVNIKRTVNFVNNLIDGVKVEEITGIHAISKVYHTKGGNIELTIGQVMSLYCAIQREQAIGHIIGSGIVPSKLVIKRKNKYIKLLETNQVIQCPDTVRLDLQDMMDIVKDLSPKQKYIAAEMMRYMSTVCADWGNETSRILYGYDKYYEQNYFPIKSLEAFLKTNFVNSGETNIKNSSFTKNTVVDANNPIVIDDIFNVFSDHTNKMSMYNALVIPLTDFQRVYNYKRNVNGVPDATVRNSIGRAFGMRANDYIETLMRDINTTNNSESSLLDSMLSRAKKNSISFSLSVLLQQPTSIMRATDIIDTKYVIKGLAAKSNKQEMLDNVPIAYWKSLGFYQTNTARSMKDIMINKENIIDKIGMGAYGKADDFAWAHLWEAVKLEQEELRSDTDIKSSEFMQLCRDRFTHIVNRTQVVDTVLHRSPLLRSKNTGIKSLVTFMNEGIKTYNMLRTDMLDAVRDVKEKNAKTNDKSIKMKNMEEASLKVTRSIKTFLVTAAATAVFKSISTAMRDDNDDEEYLEKYWNAIKKNLTDAINPLNMIPLVKDVWSLIEGWSLKRIEFNMISDLVSVLRKWTTGNYSTLYLINETAAKIANLCMVPYGNVKREIEAVVRTTANAFNLDHCLYTIDKLKYNIDNSSSHSKLIKHYVRAKTNDNEKDAQSIRKDLILNGVSPDKIDSAYYRALKNDAMPKAVELYRGGKIAESNSVLRKLSKETNYSYKSLREQVKNEVTGKDEDYDFKDLENAVKNDESTREIKNYLMEYEGYSKEAMKEAIKMLEEKYK